MIFTPSTMQTIGLAHLPLWNIDDFHSLDNTDYGSDPSAILKHRWFSFFGQPGKKFLISQFLIKKCVDDFHSSGNADNGIVHLPLWNQGDFHSLDNADYGHVHLPIWNIDDFHSLDNANYRSSPSAPIKPRWFSFFGQYRLWVRSICHFETYTFV